MGCGGFKFWNYRTVTIAAPDDVPSCDATIDGISVTVESDMVAPISSPVFVLDDRIAALEAELAQLKALRDGMFP
jgi:hypothetical protein